MMDRDDLSRIFWDDCLKIARVNVLTGAYELVKRMGTAYEQACARTSTIYAFMRTAVDLGLIHDSDRGIVQACLDKDRFARLLDQPKQKVAASFRVRLGDRYEWTTLEIMFPADFSAFAPEALFVLRRAEEDRRGLSDAMCRLAGEFHKILRVDLTGDAFEPIRLTGDERSDAAAMSGISVWFAAFAASGHVMDTDKLAFLAFTSLPRLRAAFRGGARRMTCCYRRRCGRSFRWVQMELLCDDDYSDAHQKVMLYIRDIQDLGLSVEQGMTGTQTPASGIGRMQPLLTSRDLCPEPADRAYPADDALTDAQDKPGSEPWSFCAPPSKYRCQ